MHAAVMYGPDDIRIETIDRPVCPKGGLILKVTAVGLCGSDIRNMTTDSRQGRYPHIYGHEVVGIVDEAAPDAPYQVGERLYVYPADHCLRCEPCRAGHGENCEDENYGQYASRQGGFADYFAVPKEQLSRDAVFRVPEGVDEESVSLSEPLSSVYACQDNVNVGFGETVAIVGAGPIGCFHAQIAKMRGAATVIMIEINDRRLETAKQFGVDYTVNSQKEDAVERVRALTGGRGADKVISANPSVKAQEQSIYMARRGGTVVFFGGVPKNSRAEIDTNYVHYNNLWIYGHFGASSVQVQRAFELVASGRFPAKKFITHVLPLTEIVKGIELTKSGDAIKVVLRPNT